MDASLGGFGSYSSAELAALTGASERTARRWKQAGRAPADILKLLRLKGGELGELAEAWRGWTLRDDVLVSPEGMEFRAGEIRSLPLRRQQIAALQREVQRLRELGDAQRRHDLARRLRELADTAAELAVEATAGGAGARPWPSRPARLASTGSPF